jgi:hypothetical protein
MYRLVHAKDSLVLPPYEGGGRGVVGAKRKDSNPLLDLPLHKEEKRAPRREYDENFAG